MASRDAGGLKASPGGGKDFEGDAPGPEGGKEGMASRRTAKAWHAAAASERSSAAGSSISILPWIRDGPRGASCSFVGVRFSCCRGGNPRLERSSFNVLYLGKNVQGPSKGFVENMVRQPFSKKASVAFRGGCGETRLLLLSFAERQGERASGRPRPLPFSPDESSSTGWVGNLLRAVGRSGVEGNNPPFFVSRTSARRSVGPTRQRRARRPPFAPFLGLYDVLTCLGRLGLQNRRQGTGRN